jgi:hypothetical protein
MKRSRRTHRALAYLLVLFGRHSLPLLGQAQEIILVGLRFGFRSNLGAIPGEDLDIVLL